MRAWQASMIAPASAADPAPRLRREFTLDAGHGAVVSARLCLSALGVCEAWINGRPVGPDLLTPGWSSYEWRVRYAEHDVAHLLERRSVLAVVVGNGWYRGRLGWAGSRAIYGSERAALAQLEIAFADGHVQYVVTDDSWRAGASEIDSDDLYDGQAIDARSRDDRWLHPGFDEPEGWQPVRIVPFDTRTLSPRLGPPVVRTGTRRALRVWASPRGRTLVDFGQNLVGWIRLRARGEAGTTVTVRHAEVLEHGELGIRPIRTAAATDRYTLSGSEDLFEPTFTFHGFRYAEITGWPGDPAELLTAAEAVVVGSDLRRTGSFDCSDPLLAQFHRNVVWGLKGNFLDIPTDCPQRDERLGWTGDIAVFAATAAFLFDVDGFLRDWLIDVANEQVHHDGIVPFVVPDLLKYEPAGTFLPQSGPVAVWSDAATWVPWALWTAYGDRGVLESQFDSMSAHVHAVAGELSAEGLWESGAQLGDWLDPDAPPDRPELAKADPAVVATACAYRSATIAASSADILGRAEDSVYFHGLADRIRTAFSKHYVTGGLVRSDCATVYSLAISFDLLDPADRSAAGDRLAELVEANGFRVSTGFAGTPFVCDALASTGHLETAYRLLQETSCPSWLYPVTMGATTVWERWDSMLPDGSINPGGMTSFNHYALGAVADWMHRVVAGISPLEPGYRLVRIAPRPGGTLTWVESSLETRFGAIRVRWDRDGDEFCADITIPEGVEAELDLPGLPCERVTAGRHIVASTLA